MTNPKRDDWSPKGWPTPKRMTDPKRDDRSQMGWPTLKRDDQPVGWWIRQSPIFTTRPPWVSMGLMWGRLMHPFMEITCISWPKALLCNQISYIWKGDLEYLGTFLSTRKFPHIKGFGSVLYHYINHKPYPSWGMWILSIFCTLEFLESLLLLT